MVRSVDLHEIVANASEAVLPVSDVAIRMLALATNPDAGAAEVGAIAMEDPAIVATLLREANSAAQSTRDEVGTGQDAVARLGVGRALAIAVFTSTRGVMSTTLSGYGLAANDYVRHATSSSYIAELVRQRAKTSVDPTVATAALLHDIGKILLDPHLIPTHFAAAWETHGSTIDAENELLDLNHAEVGAHLCQVWRVPEPVVDAIREHHFADVSQAPINSVAVCVAQMLADDLDASTQTAPPDAGLYASCLERLQLPAGLSSMAAEWLIERGVPYVTPGLLPS